MLHLQHLPERDTEGRKYLIENKLVSDCDGLVAKKGGWRSSFSLSEKNLVQLHLQLYQALKYLKKVCRKQIFLILR